MVSTLTFFPFLLVVHAGSRLQSLREVIASAQAAPGTVAYGTAGVGSTHHLAGELMARMARLNLLHVPYRGDAAAVTALLASDVPFIIAPPTAVMSNIQAGKLRAIATTGPQRWPSPAERAHGGRAGRGRLRRAFMGRPAGAGRHPRPVVERLHAEVQRALQAPGVRQRLENMGGEVRGSTPEEMKAMVSHEVEKWQQVVADAKIPKQ